ncbi:MAG: dTMP kinase [Pseudomonadota bacterium]
MKDAGERGHLISFEGGEGAGKSTQIKYLKAYLETLSLSVTATREPGGGPTGEALRQLVLHPPAPLSAATEALIMFAARRDHLDLVINPARAGGAVVLTDRFYDSTEAYQVAASDFAADCFKSLLHAVVLKDENPSLTIILDLDVEVGLKRAADRGTMDAFESRGRAFHDAVRRGFLAIAAREPERCVVVDADREPGAVAVDIRTIVAARLGIGGGT